jgi:long-chain acyl-CoA synthetase
MWKEVYSFNEIEGCKNWNELLIQVLILEIKAKLRIEKTMCNQKIWPLLYTGTTGRPKVMLSHQNIVSNVLDSASRIPFTSGKTVHKLSSYLPYLWKNDFIFIPILWVSVYFGESIDKISDNLKKLDQLSLLLFQDFRKVYDKIYIKELSWQASKEFILLGNRFRIALWTLR